MKRGIPVCKGLEGDGVARIFVRNGYGLAGFVFHFRRPLSHKMFAAAGRHVHARPGPDGLAVIGDEHVGKDAFPFVREHVEDFRVVFGIDIFDNPENSPFHIDRPEFAVERSGVEDVVADDALSRNHRGRRFPACRRIGSRKIGHAAGFAVDAHEEHVFGQPSLAMRACNGEAERQFFEPDGVPGVLIVDRKHAVSFQVDVNAAFVGIARNAVFESPGGVHKDEKVVGCGCGAERLIAAPVEQILGMGDIGRIGQLQRQNGKRRLRGPQTAEPDEHFLAFHDAVEQVFHFVESGLPVERGGFKAKGHRGRKQQFCVRLVPRLIACAVKMIGVSVHGQGMFLSAFQGTTAKARRILVGIVDDGDARRATQFGIVFNDFADATIGES